MVCQIDVACALHITSVLTDLRLRSLGIITADLPDYMHDKSHNMSVILLVYGGHVPIVIY